MGIPYVNFWVTIYIGSRGTGLMLREVVTLWYQFPEGPVSDSSRVPSRTQALIRDGYIFLPWYIVYFFFFFSLSL